MLLFTYFLRCGYNCCCNSVCAFENVSSWCVSMCFELKSPFEDELIIYSTIFILLINMSG